MLPELACGWWMPQSPAAFRQVTLIAATLGIWKKIKALLGGKKNWEEVEFFDPRWKKRIEAMAAHVSSGQSVLDLGCGQMWLKEFLPEDCRYFPCDYTHRGPGTIVCDFNQKEFPDQTVDVSFVSGCLEYVVDVDWFLDRIEAQSQRCVIAYCIMAPDKSIAQREQNAWKNHLSEEELITAFTSRGMLLRERGGQFMSSHLFVFEKESGED